MPSTLTSPSLPMANTCKIIQESILTFLLNYQYFISTPTLLAFPYAASYLLTQSLVSSSYLFPFIHKHLRFLFLAAGFPLSSQYFTFLCLELSKTILTLIFISPVTFSFLLLARASVIVKALGHQNPEFSYWSSLFTPLLITQLCNTIVVLAANATCFFFFALCYIFLDVLGLSSSQAPILFLSAVGAIVYSILVQSYHIICNLASVSSGMENRGGFTSVFEACVMIQGRKTNALFLAVAMNAYLSTVEALFQYRVVRAYRGNLALNSGLLVTEGVFIAFLYSVILVLDTVVGCAFWRRCKIDEQIDHGEEIDFHYVEIA